MDYFVGIGIADAKVEARRRAWLLVRSALNLGRARVLQILELSALDSVHHMLNWLGLHTSKHTLGIFLLTASASILSSR